MIIGRKIVISAVISKAMYRYDRFTLTIFFYAHRFNFFGINGESNGLTGSS